MKQHTLELIVVDEPGVMSRISTMFARRGYNIDMISVGSTQKKGISKITFTLQADDAKFDNLIKQCEKLIDVLEIHEYLDKKSIQTEMCLVKVKPHKDLASVAKKNNAEIMHESDQYVVMQIVAEHKKIQAFLKEIDQYTILDLSRSGIIGMHTRK